MSAVPARHWNARLTERPVTDAWGKTYLGLLFGDSSRRCRAPTAGEEDTVLKSTSSWEIIPSIPNSRHLEETLLALSGVNVGPHASLDFFLPKGRIPRSCCILTHLVEPWHWNFGDQGTSMLEDADSIKA